MNQVNRFKAKENVEKLKNNSEFSNPAQAIVHFHNGIIVTRKIHGNAVYNHYTHFSKSSNRLGEPTSKRQYNDRVELLKSVTLHLKDPQKKIAIKELKKYINDFGDLFN